MTFQSIRKTQKTSSRHWSDQVCNNHSIENITKKIITEWKNDTFDRRAKRAITHSRLITHSSCEAITHRTYLLSPSPKYSKINFGIKS